MNKLYTLLLILVAVSTTALAQKDSDPRVIVITTDGYRWQEVFNGIDTSIVKIKRFHHGDSARLMQQYYAPTLKERREKLMPFFWGKLAAAGQLHGNRKEGSQVDNANPYWFSYPGYSEILTGQVDTAVNSNDYKPNPNTNFFEHLNALPAYKGKVAAFGAWDAFDRILNEKRAGFPVVNAFDSYPELEKDPEMKMLAKMMKESFKPFGMAESLDAFTHFKAMHYLKKNKPKALYISYGETDEFAHEGAYNHYLDAAHQFDAWVGEIWDFVNSDPDYKGKTTLLITTDHGRGDAIKYQWTSHGDKVKDCYQIWYAMIGANVSTLGEVKSKEQVFQKDLIHKAAKSMGVDFKSVVK
jgi:Metalloenzyme superfamily